MLCTAGNSLFVRENKFVCNKPANTREKGTYYLTGSHYKKSYGGVVINANVTIRLNMKADLF